MNVRIRNFALVTAALVVLGGALALAILLVDPWTGSDAPEPSADTQAAAQVEPSAPDDGDDTSQLPRRVVPSQARFIQDAARSVESLTATSDVIVIGTVASSELIARPEYMEFPNDCSKWPTPGPENAGKVCPESWTGTFGVYTTDYVFSVDRFLKTDGTNDRELTVRSYGGIVDGEEVVVSPHAFLEKGQRYLLFLHWGDEARSFAWTGAGNLGAYELNNGRVDFFPDGFAYTDIFPYGAPLALDSLTEQDAVALVESVVAAEVAGP